MRKPLCLATLSVVAVVMFASAAGAQPSYPQDQMMQPQDQMTQPQAPAAQPQYAAPQMQAPAPAPSAPAAGAQDQQSLSVNIQNFAFDPPNITVAPGTTVTWVNNDSAPHTVTATDPAGAFDSGTLQPGQSFSFTFIQPGTTYAYYCAIHPSMTGTVTVTGGGTAAAQAGGATAQAGGGAAAQASGTGGPQLAATGGPPLLVPLAGLLLAGVGVLGLAVRRRAS